MMEAKDTVMILPKILEAIKYEDGEVGINKFSRLAQAQAEITWSIAYKAGIREIVEWIKAHSQLERCDPDVMPYFIDFLMVDYPDWQAKLREWGLLLSN